MTLEFKVVDELYYSYVNGVKGMLSQIDVEHLMDYASKIPPGGRYVETGTYLGCSAILMALRSNATVWAHDIWTENWSDLNGTEPPPQSDDYFFKFYENVLNNNLENRIIPIRGKSAYTLQIHPLKSIDFAFIDGDHSYQGCLEDLQMLYPRMKPGATILLHDCLDETECFRALRDFTSANNIRYQRATHSTGMARIQIPA
jgi:predicted O-methyltransferase YrrM